jgi:nucleoside-diphosphate-sugar epimerase
MNNWMEVDYIFFGFGNLTERIINSFSKNKQKIICVSNLQKELNLSLNVKWFPRDEIIQKQIVANNAIFVWRDTSNFGDHLLMNWMKSDSLLLNRSFLLSSSSVYKDGLGTLNEDKVNLESSFMENEKYNLERNLLELFDYKEIQHSNLRISNVYGSNLTYGFIASLVSAIKGTNKAKLLKQRDITRDYLSIKDLIIAIEGLVKSQYTEVDINVSTGIGTTIQEILQIFEEYGHDFNSRVEVDVPANLKRNVVLDCDLLKSKIMWNPSSVKFGINELLSELKPHNQFNS